MPVDYTLKKLLIKEPMPYIKTKALIIGKKLHKEHDKNLLLLLEDGRKIEAKIRKARDTSAKWGSVTEPVSEVEIDIYDRAGKYTITGIENINYFSQLSYELMVCQEFICETIDKTTPYAHHEDGLYELARQTMENLESLSKKEVLVCYLFNLLHLHGYNVHVHSCICCGSSIENDSYFDIQTGSTVCKNCKNAHCISFPLSAVNALKAIEDEGYNTKLPDKMSKGLLKLLLRILSSRFEVSFATSLHVQNIC